ncbi:hypothetical protein D3C80_1231220 [compost metagenome]
MATPFCWAIKMNSMIGAPPGSMMKGKRAPQPRRPNDCKSVPRPQTRKVALSNCSVSSLEKPSAVAIRNTDAMGDAAITSTCWAPKISSWRHGKRSSTGETGLFALSGISHLDLGQPRGPLKLLLFGSGCSLGGNVQTFPHPNRFFIKPKSIWAECIPVPATCQRGRSAP